MKALRFVLLSAIAVAVLMPARLSAAEIKGLFAAGVGVVTQELTPVFGRSLFEAITKQEADLGVYIINEIVTTPGIELVGPVPSELQFYIRYAAAILARSPEPALAKELISYLSSPAAIPVIKSKGMERD